jgi:hypothetical protein
MINKENNNGWIKVIDQENLPTEKNDYWIMTEDCVEPVICDANRLTYYSGFWGKITHYMIIIKPELPIY